MKLLKYNTEKTMNDMKIAFILGRYPNPRLKKRINIEKRLGKVVLICWEKGMANKLNFEDSDIDLYSISIKSSITNPVKRLFPTVLFTIKSIKKLIEISPDILHVENVDMLFVAYLYTLFRRKKVKIIYEIADLHRLVIDPQTSFIGNILKRIIISIEKFLCKHINILIITSEKFYDIYYKDFVNKDKVIFIPNMPELSTFKNYRKKQGGKFTIGFIGGIRYKEQMKLLIDAADKSNVNILFAGFSFDDEIKNYADGKNYVKFYGKYDYDKEIADLYGQVDCVYSVYDADLNNVKVALPNKLYESIYCELPIIVAKNTYLSEIIEDMGVGISVAHKDIEDLIKVIDKLSNDANFYNSLVKSCQKHKKDINITLYNDELIKKIMSLFN